MSAKACAALMLLSFVAACGGDDGDRGSPPTIGSFSATPNALTATADVVLTWDVSDATTIAIDPEIGEVSGATITTKVYAPTQFVLTATNSAGSVSKTVAVSMTLPAFLATVDGSLTPGMAALTDGQPIAASADGENVQTDFVVDEVRIHPRNRAELDSFVSRVQGTIIGDDGIPTPPPSLQITAEPNITEYRVRFDSTGYSLATLTADAAGAGLGGAMRFSSQRALEFFAAVTHEAASGVRVWPNFVDYGDALLQKTTENGNRNAFDKKNFPRYQNYNSRASIVQAWQWVAAHGTVKSPIIAIVDSGFNLDTNGNPVLFPGDIADFPPPIPQYDFVGADYVADGASAYLCTGGSPCPWHGNRSASVAGALVNNGGGSAGTGGTVASVMMLRIDGTHATEAHAMRTAQAWGADVINASFGGACNLTCRQYDRDSTAYRNALAAGVVIVASAGNDNADTRAENYYHPCIIDDVICIGALDDDSNTRISYSNYGAGLIWAPTNVFAVSDPQSGPTVLPNHSGTSASAPFVSGIVAMMKAIDPSINASSTVNILRSTAFTDSPDSNVTHIVNALKAVQAVSAGVLPPDALEANNSIGAARPLASGLNQDLRVSIIGDPDYYTVNAPTKSTLTLDLAWSSGIGKLLLLDGGLTSDDACGLALQRPETVQATGRRLVYDLPPGTHGLAIGAVTPMPYDVTISVVDAGPTVFTDGYEPNETLATARGLPNPTIVKANLSVLDVDFYSVYGNGSYTNGPLNLQNVVEVLGADAPITLTVYNGAGTVVATSTTSADCKTPARAVVPQGTHRIGVTAARFTDYVLYIGGKVTSVEQYITADAYSFTIVPDERFELVLPDYEEWVVLDPGSDFDVATLDIFTPDIHATTFMLDGTLLYEGVAADFDGLAGETVQAPVSLGAPILMRLTRVVTGAPGATPTAVTVALQGNMAM